MCESDIDSVIVCDLFVCFEPSTYSIKFKYISKHILNKLTILFKNLVGYNVLFAPPD